MLEFINYLILRSDSNPLVSMARGEVGGVFTSSYRRANYFRTQEQQKQQASSVMSSSIRGRGIYNTIG